MFITHCYLLSIAIVTMTIAIAIAIQLNDPAFIFMPEMPQRT
jgi:hypothetical protein